MKARASSTYEDGPSCGGTRSPGWSVIGDFGASYTVQMPVEAWINLPDHPRRRDTARHVRKRQWALLRTAQGPVFESLRWVVAAEVAGEAWKVDGHARALLWANGGLPRPDNVFAKVFRCGSHDELHDLYSTFDHPAAAETVFDRVSGAYRQHGLILKSERLRSGTIADALYIAWRGVARSVDKGGDDDDVDIYEVVGTFVPELRLLDTVDPQNDIFYTGVVAAGLLSLALDPQLVGYFGRLSRREGNKREGLLDPVEALLHMIGRLKQRRGAWVKAQQEQLCAAALTGAFAWQAGESHPHYWVRETLPAMDVHELVQRVREKKRLQGENPASARGS